MQQVDVLYALLILLLSYRVPKLEGKKVVQVGNEMGWTNYDIESFKVPNYASWSASQKVVVGDQIVFKYAKGRHNIYLLQSKSDYASCDFAEAKLLDAGGSGVFVWNAVTAGEFFFGCNKSVEEEGNHCGSGQKLALLVSSATPTLVSSSPQSSPNYTPASPASKHGHQLAAPAPSAHQPDHHQNSAANDPHSLVPRSTIAVACIFSIRLILHNNFNKF